MVQVWRGRAALLVLGGFATSCTLVGVGVGAGIDSAIPGPYENRPAAQQRQLLRGDRLRIHLGDGHRIDGKYWGITKPIPTNPEICLIVETDEGPRFIRESDVQSVDVEVTGKGWLYGGIIGVVVDVAVVVAVVVKINNAHTAPVNIELGK